MNEEIDIIELLRRVKEGNAPKEIEIKGKTFKIKDKTDVSIELLYFYKRDDGNIINWIENIDVLLDTKIKILDKPIIDKLPEITATSSNIIKCNRDKINEIIDFINNKE